MRVGNITASEVIETMKMGAELRLEFVQGILYFKLVKGSLVTRHPLDVFEKLKAANKIVLKDIEVMHSVYGLAK